MRDRTALKIPPGVNRAGSEAEMTGHWYDTQLVRWVEGVLRPIGGWERIVFDGVTTPASTVRALYVWTDNSNIVRTAIFCDAHLYVLEGNTLLDISPVPALTAPSANPVAGGYGDWAYYGAGGGIAEPDTPEVPGAALPPVYTDPDGYGTARPERPEQKLIDDVFSLSNWGEDLLAMSSIDGRLLRWKPSGTPGSVAEVVPNAPIGRQFVVTPERHVIIFQAYTAADPIDQGGFATFSWCDQEDVENWAYLDITSMAGRFNVEPAGPIVAAIVTRTGTLFFTPYGAYLVRYVGLPYVYTYSFIGKYAAPLTSASLIRVIDLIAWPAPDGFWSFNGTTVEPVACPVLDWMQQTSSARYSGLRTAGFFLGAQTESWWFFPSKDATENDRYVIWNFQDQWWAIGQLKRNCGSPGTSTNYPLMSDGTSLFRHEYGTYYYDAPLLPFAQTGAINIAEGDRLSTVTRGIVDTRAPAEDVEFYVGTRQNRIFNGTQPDRLKGPFAVRSDGKLDLRATGRDLIIRIQSTRSGVEPWSFGKMLVKLNPRGQR
jgi:hypothetical protein